jgi:glucose/mannose transport system permease protein
MMALPQNWTIEPWLSAWSTAQIGVEPTGLQPYFMNSIMMVVPAVIDLDHRWRAQRLCADQVAVSGRHAHLRAAAVRCFIPFQIVLIPMARMLGHHGASPARPRA